MQTRFLNTHQPLKRQNALTKAGRWFGLLGLILCGTPPGYTTLGQASVSVGVNVGLPSVEIHAESDFYEPLTPYGRWEVVGSYGRCWIPGRVMGDWRPYSEGYWQYTDAGWYWFSDEAWAWATYHYGRWDLSAEYGWYWVPQTQWAPAWVSWHRGGGYVGWAPLYPSSVNVISPRAYVFVEERHFMEPVRRSKLVVNNTTIISKSVINEAPGTAIIEKASGRKIQALPVQELRRKQEAAVVVRHTTPVSAGEKKVPTTVRGEAVSGEKKTAVGQAPANPAPKNNQVLSEKHAPVLATAATKPVVEPEAKTVSNHPVVVKKPAQPKVNKQPAKQENSAQPPDKKAQPVSEQPVKEQPIANERPQSSPSDKDHENEGKE